MSYYIKHKDEGCGIICHRARVRNPMQSQTIDDVAYKIHKQQEPERRDRADSAMQTLISKYKNLNETNATTARSILANDLRNILSNSVSANISQTSTTQAKRTAAIVNVLSLFDKYVKQMSPNDAMRFVLEKISYDNFQDITGWQYS